MPGNKNICIPIIDSNVLAEQHNLHRDVTNNQKNCAELKDFMLKLLSAAKSSKSDGSTSSSSTYSCSNSSNITCKSVKSIHTISSDGKTTSPEMENHELDTPSLDDYLSMAASGKIDFTDELMKELYAVNTRVDNIIELSSDIMGRWSELDSTINQLKKDILSIKQYLKVDNLLLHNFIIPPHSMTSLEFSDYVVKQLNILLPNLPIPIALHHISTAHYLPTKSQKSVVVVVVRFCNRNIKDMVYANRQSIANGLLITEHLTDENQAICKKAIELFGPSALVFTESCKVYVGIDGKSIRVHSIDDVQKIFSNFCERIGNDDNYVFPNSPVNIERNHSTHLTKTYSNRNCFATNHNGNFIQQKAPRQIIPYSNRTFLNSNHRNFNSKHTNSRKRGYWGKPSTGYSVHNRQY